MSSEKRGDDQVARAFGVRIQTFCLESRGAPKDRIDPKNLLKSYYEIV